MYIRRRVDVIDKCRYRSHKSKIADDVSDDCALVRGDDGDRIVGDPDLKEGDDPDYTDDEECDEGGYLVFDVVAELDEA